MFFIKASIVGLTGSVNRRAGSLSNGKVIGALDAKDSKLPITHNSSELFSYYFSVDLKENEVTRGNDGIHLPWAMVGAPVYTSLAHIYSADPSSQRSIQISGPTILPSTPSTTGAFYGSSLIHGHYDQTAKNYQIAFKKDIFKPSEPEFILDCPGPDLVGVSLALSATHYCILSKTDTINIQIFALKDPYVSVAQFSYPLAKVGLLSLSADYFIIQLDSNISIFKLESLKGNGASPHSNLDLKSFGSVLSVGIVDSGSHLILSLADYTLIAYDLQTTEQKTWKADQKEIDLIKGSFEVDPDWDMEGVENALWVVSEDWTVELLVFLAEAPGEHQDEWNRVKKD